MTTATTPQAEVNETAKENLIKRFAKAFYAKMAKAASAVSHFVQRIAHANDLVAPVKDEEAPERSLHLRASQFILGALKLVGSLAASLVKFVVGILIALVGIVIGIVMMIVLLAIGVLLLVVKVVQGLALFMASPYNYVRDADNSRLQWRLYFQSWTPQSYKLMLRAYRDMKQSADDLRNEAGNLAEEPMDVTADPLQESVDRHPANGPETPPVPPKNQSRKSRRQRHLHVVPSPAVG